MALQPSRLILHSRHTSSCCARVRIAASLKNIPLEIIEHGQGAGVLKLHKDSSYLEKNPNGTVPALEAYYGNGESLVLTQSLSMLEFLEESFSGGTRLLPPVTDMTARCRVRDLALLVACDIQPLQTARFHNDLKYCLPSDPEVLAHPIPVSRHVNSEETRRKTITVLNQRLLARSFSVYEAIARKSTGKFSVGDHVSIADIALVAAIPSMKRARPNFNYGEIYPTIARVVEACEGIDAFRDQRVFSLSSLSKEQRISMIYSPRTNPLPPVRIGQAWRQVRSGAVKAVQTPDQLNLFRRVPT